MSSWNDYPERDWLIQNRDYFNRLITNSSLRITPRIRNISERVRHINSKLLHMVTTYTTLNQPFIDMVKSFLRTFNSEGDYNRLKLALQRRGINVYNDDDDNSSVEVQRDRREPIVQPVQPTLSNPFHYNERGGMIARRTDNQNIAYLAFRAMRRGGITEEHYYDVIRRLQESDPEFTLLMEHINRDMSDTIVMDTTIPALERVPQRPSVDAFVEHLIVRPNIKMTDWKQEKPEECPICCGECDEHPLSCGHYVCSDCIVNSKKATCPCCRQDVALDVPVYQRLYNKIYN
jgi:hypothetical protein